MKRVAMAQAPEAGGIWPPRQAPVGAEGAAPVLSSHWVQKLDKDQQLIEKRWQHLEGKLPKMEKPTWEKRLRMEPRLLSRKLAGQLQQWERKRPQSPWEEQPGGWSTCGGLWDSLCSSGEPQLLPSFPQASVPKSASPTSHGQVSLWE